MYTSTRAAAATALLLTFIGGDAFAQVAGTTPLGISVTRMEAVALGWSARRQILGQVVTNQEGEKVGRVDDLIVAPDSAVSFAVIGAGGFVGLKRHDVLIPVDQFTVHDDGSLELPGATKDAIKQLPAFEYTKAVGKKTFGCY